MSVNKIQSFYTASYMFCSGYDSEEAKIMRKLRQYGVTPSGNKNTDKMKLHEIELREAKKENCVTTRFLTVTKAEQERIQEKKKEKCVEANPQDNLNTAKGQKILGEQLYMAIKMKDKKNSKSVK